MSSSSRSTVPPPWWWVCAEIGQIVCILYLVAPAPPPGVNEPHYLCRLRHAIDPEFCPGDIFLESPDAHYTFVVAFAYLTQFLPLTAVAWIGRLGTLVALAWAWRRLSRTVVPRPLFAVLGAAILASAIAEGNLAGEWLVGGFEAKGIAYVFVLLGLRAWVMNRWNWTWVHFGMASAWHVLVGGWSVVIVFALWLFAWRREQPLVNMLPGLLVGGAISLAGVLPALALNAAQSPDVGSEAARIYVFERLPHHLAPLHKPAAWIAERAGRHATVTMLFVALLFIRRVELGGWSAFERDEAGRIAIYSIGAMALALVGMAIELALWNHPHAAASLLRYYWFRLTDVAVPIGLAMLWIRLLADMLGRNDRFAPAMLFVMLLTSGYPIATRLVDYVQSPWPPAVARMRNPDDWLDVCGWIEENTPSDAVFLTPRGNSSFKWYAQRPEVVTYKDIPQNARSLVEWRSRLYDVYTPGGDPEQPWVRSLGELGTTRVRELANKYNATYVLTTVEEPLGFEMPYDNDTYAVYRISPPNH